MNLAELHTLVKSIEAPDTVDSLSNGFYTLTPDELLLLCKKAQAQALRHAYNHAECLSDLMDMADELEGKL